MNEDLFRALPALLKEFDDNESLREAVVFAAWRQIAGESLREHAVPLRLYQKHLIVAVMSETWKKHLEHLSGQMIFKFNSALGTAARHLYRISGGRRNGQTRTRETSKNRD